MPAEVESLAYVSNEENGRFVPWHGLGTPVDKAMTSKEALVTAGLDWKVNPQKIYLANGQEIKDTVANVRDKDNSVLGVVSNKYKIVQNTDAFDFTDALIGNGCTAYETAGSLRSGKTIFLLARMPKTTILGDDVDPFLCFTNTHDGSGAVRVCATPIRVCCSNTLNYALNSAKRSWSCKHMGNIQGKLAEAKFTLGLANSYINELAIKADKYSQIKVSDAQVEAWCNELFPIADEDSDCKKKNAQLMKDGIISCYLAPDIAKFKGTAWGVLNAISDFATHTKPNRETTTYWERNFEKVLNGHPIMDYFQNKVDSLKVK